MVQYSTIKQSNKVKINSMKTKITTEANYILKCLTTYMYLNKNKVAKKYLKLWKSSSIENSKPVKRIIDNGNKPVPSKTC
jgi:hypothetical protein